MEPLRLVALDQDDLAVISTHLQDATVRVGDLKLLPQERRFAMCAQRFEWEADPSEPPRRRLTGLLFERVAAARTRGIDRQNPDATLTLLGVTFTETDSPSGCATLWFEDGSAIQLDLECIETRMKDLGPVFPCECRPVHDVEEA
jgi:hypothetical protein